MNNRDKKFKDIGEIFLACLLFGAFLFFFHHNFSEPAKNTKSEKHSEYVLSYKNPVISEKYELKIFRPLPCSFSFPESIATNSQHESAQTLTVPEKNFSQIKILLKQRSYNLFFASGFHEPLLAA